MVCEQLIVHGRITARECWAHGRGLSQTLWGKKMIRRRAFLLGATATVGTLGLIRPGSAMAYEKAIEWFIELVKAFPASMDAIYRGLLYIKAHYRLLVDDRARLQNVRRELADPSTEKGLQTKLGTWLNHYDAFLADKQRPGENDEEFAARKNNHRTALEQEWRQLRNDAVQALIAVSRNR
jgi:hypothetical protein